MKSRTVEVAYNYLGDKDLCFMVEKDGGVWYAVKGSIMVNFTYDEIKKGDNVCYIEDLDVITVLERIYSEKDLIKAIELKGE